jgi:uncharacterized protein
VTATAVRRASAATAAQRSHHPHEVNWIVKASKLCNLRCRYCYEWNELDSPERIKLSEWTRLLEAVRDYHLMLRDSLRDIRNVRSNIIWHGGEPLLLPTAYFERVFEAQHEILDAAGIEYCNVLQSNLYTVANRTLEVLEREQVQLGVSFDLMAGVRLTAGGDETEHAVAANIDSLQKRGVSLGAVVVLAGHTSRHVRRIYDFYAARGMPVRFLPLFDAPLNTPEASFALTTRATVGALKRLFDYWIRRPRRIGVWPLIDYVYTALLRRTGEARQTYDRRSIGEWALLVNTDGSLYHRPDAYNPDLALGNVFHQTMRNILSSDAYAESLGRDGRLTQRFCNGCDFLGPCNTIPIFESPRTVIGKARCGIAYPLYRYVERYFDEKRFTTARIQQILLEV